LSQFRGHPTILALYPTDFFPICKEQPYWRELL
jgi:peroxiredoxin